MAHTTQFRTRSSSFSYDTILSQTVLSTYAMLALGFKSHDDPKIRLSGTAS
jgi:hypothetical protein